MRYALITASVVHGVVEAPDASLFGEYDSCPIIPANSPVRKGWRWDGAAFLPYLPTTIYVMPDGLLNPDVGALSTQAEALALAQTFGIEGLLPSMTLDEMCVFLQAALYD
jgi:hypothetical protein